MAAIVGRQLDAPSEMDHGFIEIPLSSQQASQIHVGRHGAG